MPPSGHCEPVLRTAREGMSPRWAAVRHSAALMQHYNDDPEWRVWWRRGFAAFLLLALFAGLFLSFRPSGFDDEPEVASDAEETEAPSEAPGEGEADPTEPAESDEDDGLSEAEAEELIAAARDPEETTVQVLDAGGGSTATNDAADALREMGYDVVAINSSRTDYDVTTVLFTDGNEAEAQALRARDEKFAEIGPNERLSEGVDLHVVVGPDWG